MMVVGATHAVRHGGHVGTHGWYGWRAAQAFRQNPKPRLAMGVKASMSCMAVLMTGVTLPATKQNNTDVSGTAAGGGRKTPGAQKQPTSPRTA